jgi:AcrR family transcriptional regulator
VFARHDSATKWALTRLAAGNNINGVKLTALTCVMIKSHRSTRTYHHGDLREALLNATREEIERGGYESLSMRDLAASLGVSEAAPYHHFADKRALLAAVAAQGFRDLEAAAMEAMEKAGGPAARMEQGARAYLAFAAHHPQLFRLMFVSDLLTSAAPRDSSLVSVASQFHHQFEAVVSGICDNKDERSIKAAALAIWSLLHGFALLRMGNRLMPFMLGPLSDADLAGAVLSVVIDSPKSISRGIRIDRNRRRTKDRKN